MAAEKTFRAPQIIPPIFTHSKKGCAMFKRFFLYRYCFEEEIEKIDEEIKDNLTVKKTFCGEKKFYVYADSEMKLTPEQE